MGTKIKVVSLNCWGVPFPVVSKLRPERIAAIGKELAKAEYEIILLQEIWSQRDYDSLCAKLLTVLPYTHYFHSGVIGSGLCIFSKFPILETQTFPFTLNGYAHKILHGDWYGCKAVGLAKIIINDIKINVYVTHLHADYSVDTYNAHRAAQAFELSQIIKNTSDACDMVVVGGDFNYGPSDVGVPVVLHNANVKDAWLNQRRKVTDENEGCTNSRHDNSFASLEQKESKFPGKRIDFLFYRANNGCSVDCTSCWVTLQQVPGENYNYSDHEAVAAEFLARRHLTAIGPNRNAAEIEKSLTEVLTILDIGINKVKSDRIFFGVALFLCLVALVYTAEYTTPWTFLGSFVGIFRTLLTIGIAFFFWMIAIMSQSEIATLTATKKDISNLLKSNPV